MWWLLGIGVIVAVYFMFFAKKNGGNDTESRLMARARRNNM